VRGTGFGYAACNDTGGAPEQETADAASPEPLSDIRLVLRQGGREWELATVEADSDFSFEARVRLPDGAEAGRVALSAEPDLARTRLRILER